MRELSEEAVLMREVDEDAAATMASEVELRVAREELVARARSARARSDTDSSPSSEKREEGGKGEGEDIGERGEGGAEGEARE